MAKDRHPATKVHRGITVGEELANLERMFPRKSGNRLLSAKEQLRRKAKSATLWLYVQSGQEFALHESLFAKLEERSSSWWADFFSSKVFKGTGSGTGTPAERMGIIEGSIIPGMNLKSRKRWSVRAVIGYNLHDLQRVVYTAIHTRRNKA